MSMPVDGREKGAEKGTGHAEAVYHANVTVPPVALVGIPQFEPTNRVRMRGMKPPVDWR